MQTEFIFKFKGRALETLLHQLHFLPINVRYLFQHGIHVMDADIHIQRSTGFCFPIAPILIFYQLCAIFVYSKRF